MISHDVSSLLAHRLRKLAQSGAQPQELQASIQQMLQMERGQKLASGEYQQDFMVPFFSGRKVHLNLV